MINRSHRPTNISSHYLRLLFTVCCAFSLLFSRAQPAASGPESLGISSQAILDFIDAAEKERPGDIHGFVLMRHGQVAAQGWWNPYQPGSPHMLYSLSKSFTSTAIGIAQSEGLLSINDKVISFFPGIVPDSPSANMQNMRIRDLLAMNSGHNQDATDRMRKDTTSWIKGFLSLPVEHKPGTHFVYNSAATYMLSAIIQKVSGKKLIDYLTPRLFQPLGIEQPTWETSPEGINMGGWGLKVRTGDIAKFGQLYLQKGIWQGKQLVPATWVEEATKRQTSNGSNPESDWDQGYGYQFWMCRYGLYRGDGAFGQYCIVFPKQDAVLAINAGTANMGAIMNLVWKYLLPAFKESPLEANTTSYTALQNKLTGLSLPRIEGKATSPKTKSITNAAYILPDNDEGITSVAFNFKAKEPTITFTFHEKPVTLPLGIGTIKGGQYITPDGISNTAATSAAWISPDTLRMRLWLSETPFSFTYDFTFTNKEVDVKRESHVNTGAGKLQMKGKQLEVKNQK